MEDRSASLLTKTQRKRLQNGFEDVDDAAKRRDQRLIRERLSAGVLDFTQLASLSDDQFTLALDDLSDEELQAALADAQATIDRIGRLRGIDADESGRDDRHHRPPTTPDNGGEQSPEQLSKRSAPARAVTSTDRESGSFRWIDWARIGTATGGLGLLGGSGLFLVLPHSCPNWRQLSQIVWTGSAGAGVLAMVCIALIVLHELQATVRSLSAGIHRLRQWKRSLLERVGVGRPTSE